MKQKIKITGLMTVIVFLSYFLVSCVQKESSVQILDNPENKPEYLSLFSPNSLSGSDVGKYWSDRFADIYNNQIYVNYDGAWYYDSEGISYRELLEKRIQSSMPDDLYIINAEDVLDFEKKGYWMDLSEMDFVNNLSEAALYQSTYNGKVFSVPLCFTGFGFYWNVDLLNKYNLDIPQNFEEFMYVCEKLKANKVLPYGANKGYALTVPAMCKGLSKLYKSSDIEQRINDLNRKDVLISTYIRDGFEFIDQMIDKGYLDPYQALNTNPSEELEMFLNGECAFICTGMGSIIEEPEKVNFQTEMTGLPILEEGYIAVYGADLRLCINPNSNNINTAIKFVEMVGTPEALDVTADLKNVISSAKDSKIIEDVQIKKLSELLRQPGQIPNQDFALHFNIWENIRNVCRDICNGISVDEACNKIDNIQCEELEKFAEN